MAQVQAAAPDLVAFSTTTHQYPYIERYAGYLREARPRCCASAAARIPRSVPEEVAASPAFDVVCVGEGEYALRDLVERLERGEDYADIPNLWVRRDEQVIRNPLRPLIADLDELPYVDRELFDYDELLAANDGWVDMMVGPRLPLQLLLLLQPRPQDALRGPGQAMCAFAA